jgi:hypothetical protein
MPARGGRAPPPRRGSLLALVLALPGGLVAQQTAAAPAGVNWTLDTLRSGFCIHFLVEPAAAGRGLFRGVTQRPASATPALNAVLKRTIEASPELASWVPQRFCVLQFSAVGVDNRELRDTKHGRSQVVATWSTSAQADAPGSVVLLVNNSRLSNSLKSIGMSIDVLRCEFGKVPESTDDRYEIRYDRSTLTWDGHASGDSTAAPAMTRDWVVPGRNARTLAVRQRIDPVGARLMVGALRIEGKGELAQALTSSPIRYVGPIIWGGSGSMSFAVR